MYINEPLYIKYIVVYLFKFYSNKFSQFRFVNLGHYYFLVSLGFFSFVLIDFRSPQFFFLQVFVNFGQLMGLQFIFVNFGQFGGFFFKYQVWRSLALILWTCLVFSFFFFFWSSGVFNYFLFILGVFIYFYFFLWGDGVFEFHFGLLFYLPCDGSNHRFLL